MPKPYELGVLFVHGIGQQKQGETLVNFGEPLAQCIRDRFTLARPAAELSPEDVGFVELKDTALGGEGKEPAHAELIIRNIDRFRFKETGKPDARWLLAEGWWAESFPTPTYDEIAKWALDILPWTLIAHFDRQLRRAGFRVPNAPTRAEQVWTVILCVGLSLRLVAALFLVPVVAAIVLLMLVIGYLPIPKVRSVISSVQRGMAASVGDSFILVGRPIAGAAILSRVRQALDWLAARCERIVIVAHSQGAAIAHQVVQSDPLIECDRFVTLGSGLQKLTEIRDATKSRGQLWLRVASGALLAAAFFLYLLLASEGKIKVFYAVTGALSLALVWLAFDKWRRLSKKFTNARDQWLQDRELYIRKYRLAQAERLPWLDGFASADPVPNGALLDEFLPDEMRTRGFRNRHSMLADHNAYWQNRDDFVARLSYAVLSEGGIDISKVDSKDGRRQSVAAARRNWRVGWLVAARYVVFTLGLTMLFAWWFECPSYMSEVLNVSNGLLARIPQVGGVLVTANASGLRSPAGISALVALSLGLYGTLYLIWTWWDAHEMRLRYERKQYEMFERRSLVFITVFLSEALGVLALVLVARYGVAGLWWLLGIPGVLSLVGLTDALRMTRFGATWRAWSASGALETASLNLDKRWRRRLRRGCGRGLAWAAYELGRHFCYSDPPRIHRAVAACNLAIELGSGPAAWLLGHQLENRDPQGAIDAYQQGMDLKDPFCPWFLGRLQEKQGDEKSAIKTFQKGLYELKSPACAHNLGLLLWKTDRAMAKSAYEEGVALGDTLSSVFLGDALSTEAQELESDPSKVELVEALRRQAELCYRKGLNQGSSRAAIDLANLLRERGDIDGARLALLDGIKLRNGDAALQLGQLLELEREDEAARVAYERAIDLAILPEALITAHYHLGAQLHKLGHKEAAIRLYQKATGLPGERQGSQEAAIRLGDLLRETTRESELTKVKARVRLAYGRAIELGSAEAAMRLGKFLKSLGDLNGAEAAYRQGADLKSPIAAVELGRFLKEDRGEYEGARRAYQQAALWGSRKGASKLVSMLATSDLEGAREASKLDPRLFNESDVLRLGQILDFCGDVDTALAVYGAFEYSAKAMLAMGSLLTRTGRFDEAYSVYEKAMGLGSAEAACRVGERRRASNDLIGAREAFQLATSFGSEEATTELAAVEKLLVGDADVDSSGTDQEKQ